MKNIFNLIISGILLSLIACDEDWKNEDAPMNNIAHYEDIIFSDYGTLTTGSFPALNGYFTPRYPATDYLETWLNSNYFTVDVNSTANITYNFMDYDRADSLDNLSQIYLTLESLDYRQVWGTPFIDAFTPSVPAEAGIAEILNKKEPSAADNSYRVIQYNYSPVEPLIEKDQDIIYYHEDFESFSSYGSWSNFDIPGIFRSDVWGVGRNWQIYNSSGIVGMLGYLRNGPGGNVWFITYELDLSAAINPVFQFDLGIGYYEGVNSLNVLVSEDFDGSNPLIASWENLNEELNIDGVNKVSGYPNPLTTLSIKLGNYSQKKIYLAFQNTLPVQSSNYTDAAFYVIDNIKLSENRDVATIPDPEIKYTVFKRISNTWKELNSVYILQEDDYTTLGLTTLTTEEAHELIPTLLNSKISGSQSGDELVIIYKQTATQCYAENYIYSNGKWEYQKLPEIEQKTDSFLYRSLEEKWKQQ